MLTVRELKVNVLPCRQRKTAAFSRLNRANSKPGLRLLFESLLQ